METQSLFSTCFGICENVCDAVHNRTHPASPGLMAHCEPCFEADWGRAGQPSAAWSGEEFLNQLTCVQFGGGRFCLGAPGLRWQCRGCSICTWSVGDYLSMNGLLGMFELSGSFISVVTFLLLLFSVILYVGWCVFVVKTLRDAMKWLCRKNGNWSVADSWATVESYLLADPLKDLPPELRQQAEDLVNHHRVERCRMAARITFGLLPLLSARGLIDEAFHILSRAFTKCSEYENGCWPEDVHRQQRAGSHVALSTFLLLACMGPALQPHRAGSKTPLIMHVSIYAGVAWHLLEMTRMEEWQTWQQTMFVYIRLAAAVIDGNAPLVAALNVSLICLQFGFLASKQFMFLELHEMSSSVSSAFIIYLLTATMQHARRDLVKQLLLASSMSEENTKVKGMLTLMCDAVVELRDHRIQSACPQLAALTLRGSQFGMEGKRLLDLICVEDRGRCVAALEDSSSPCALLHVRLLDGLGSSLPVQLFIATLCACSTVSQHVIGIRDNSEPGMMMVSSPEDENGVPLFPLHMSLASGSVQAEVIGAAGSDCESERTGRGRAPSVLSSLPERMTLISLASDAIVTVVDCPAGWPEIPVVWLRTDSSWSMLRATKSFVHVVGPSSLQASTQSDFRTWMPPDRQREWERWAKWVQKKPAARAGAGYAQVRLMPPGLAGTTICCHLIFLCAGIAEESADESDITSMAFMLADVSYRRTRAKDKEDLLEAEDGSQPLRL
eukprot:TRINITY_DN15554_c0_g3_i1.p1 TRINITY_DN15554_c0_g3~~TRINITY_DN15554_c0_g3_i1.p1  ORF type:complete len:727 (+),score=86.36 TRINITY_DN15554_c0_g3_i1:108-2288(+)